MAASGQTELNKAMAHFAQAKTIIEREIARLNELADRTAAKKYVSKSEASRLIGVHPSTILRMIQKNEIKTQMVGSREMIVMDSIKKLIGEKKNGKLL